MSYLDQKSLEVDTGLLLTCSLKITKKNMQTGLLCIVCFTT